MAGVERAGALAFEGFLVTRPRHETPEQIERRRIYDRNRNLERQGIEPPLPCFTYDHAADEGLLDVALALEAARRENEEP